MNIFMAVFVSALLFVGYTVTDNAPSHKTEAWQSKYSEFLTELNAIDDSKTYRFSLWDFDNDGTDELLILYTSILDMPLLSVYSYAEDIYLVGEYTNSKLDVAGLRFSENPMIHGLFTICWGGGIENFGYLNIDDGQLIHEDLLIINRADDELNHENAPPFANQMHISENKELIDESLIAFPPYEYTDNNLTFYHVSEYVK